MIIPIRDRSAPSATSDANLRNYPRAKKQNSPKPYERWHTAIFAKDHDGRVQEIIRQPLGYRMETAARPAARVGSNATKLISPARHSATGLSGFQRPRQAENAPTAHPMSSRSGCETALPRLGH